MTGELAVDVDVVDLFAGPGGWEEGLKLHEDTHGRFFRVLGIEWDTHACATGRKAGHPRLQADIALLDPKPYYGIIGLIASPPCPGFSAAGLGHGRKDLELILNIIVDIGNGWDVDFSLDVVRNEQHDFRSALTLEPLRWTLATEPQWTVWEQVPAVLPIWEECAIVLRKVGYSVWVGKLHAEEFGVPQTRTRAVLIAKRGNHELEPVPTHRRYKKKDGRGGGNQALQPWVSMADALGMDSGWEVRSNYGSGGDPKNRGIRTADEPAATVTSKVDRNKWRPTAANEGTTDEDMEWAHNRPSHTIVGSFAPEVVAAPAWRKPGDGPRQKAKGSVRITIAEASVLQSFPADYPWQGPKTAQFRQVGDACPPRLAAAIFDAADV